MLKTQYPTDYLKKELVNLEVAESIEEQHIEQQAWQQVAGDKEDNKGLKRPIEDLFSDQELSLNQRKRRKRSHDPQPGTSRQEGRLNSKQQEQSPYDNANHKLEEFTKYFIKEFEAKLHAYYMIIEGEAKKAGKFSDKFSGKVGQGIGAIVGGIIG